MIKTVKLSSKNQITLPMAIIESINLKKGDQIVITTEDNKIILRKKRDIFKELAGSLEMPKKYKGESIDYMIKASKKEYFSKKRKK